MNECIKSCTGNIEHHRWFGPQASVVFNMEKNTDKLQNTCLLPSTPSKISVARSFSFFFKYQFIIFSHR